MAFKTQKRWLARFTLPDGEHVMTGFASTKEKAEKTFRASVRRNPEASLVEGSVREARDPAVVDADVQSLRDADPSRPLANDLGLDSPERVLTDPWVVPGSQVEPPPTTFGQ